MPRRFNISRAAIAYAPVTAVVWALVVIAGIAAFASLKYTLLPDLTIPVIVVDATTPGRTPDAQTLERTVTRPLEALLAHAGATTLRSTTKPGKVSLALSFEVGNTLDQRRLQVQGLLVHGPVPPHVSLKVTPVDINENDVVTYALTRAKHAQLLYETGLLASQAVPAFEAVPGVLRADLIGADKTTAVRFNGAPAAIVRIVKKGGANALDVAAGTDLVAARVRALLNVPLVTAATQVPYIREASHATTDALGIAMALSILVVFPFLRDVRATLISAIAIPVSLAATSIAMLIFHFNLETITLLALTLVTGVIVDDAIVDVENIVRHIEEGEAPRSAAESATDEIGLTVSAATLTIVAVFLPIALMTGTLGQFFRPFGLTASVAVLTSLAVARTLSPMLAARWLRARGAVQERREPQAYLRVLRWALAHRGLVIGGAIASFAIGLAIVPLIPKGFVPHLDRGAFIVHAALATPGAHPVRDATRAAEKVDAAIRTDFDVAGVLAAVGDRSDPALATLTVTLRPNRRATTIAVEDRVRALLPALPGVTTSVEDVPFVDNGVTKPLSMLLSGGDPGELDGSARALARRLSRQPGFVDVTASGLDVVDGVPRKITHENGRRVIDVDADLTGVSIGDATARADAIARRTLPAGVRFAFGGQSQDTITTFGSFGVTLALSTVSIVVVLWLLFRGWRAPLVIVTALPLSVAGAFFALFVVRADFGLISLMGVIFLFGLVNKNAILLVDAIEQDRRAGRSRSDAILAAGSRRFRPILMTTAATILGMLPIAAGFGAGAELRSPMAIAIIGGLISSTVLSLVVIPVAYTLVEPA